VAELSASIGGPKTLYLAARQLNQLELGLGEERRRAAKLRLRKGNGGPFIEWDGL